MPRGRLDEGEDSLRGRAEVPHSLMRIGKILRDEPGVTGMSAGSSLIHVFRAGKTVKSAAASGRKFRGEGRALQIGETFVIGL